MYALLLQTRSVSPRNAQFPTPPRTVLRSDVQLRCLDEIVVCVEHPEIALRGFERGAHEIVVVIVGSARAAMQNVVAAVVVLALHCIDAHRRRGGHVGRTRTRDGLESRSLVLLSPKKNSAVSIFFIFQGRREGCTWMGSSFPPPPPSQP